ncbi:hypothetical protein PV326_004954 [Microctonus aethiopoides]|nr:hypothetical protein PV326_004954 [Microctonus aethiopoides]
MDDIDDLLDNVDDPKDTDFNIKDYKDTVESEDSASYEEPNDNDPKANKNDKFTNYDELDEDRGPILPGGHHFDKKFICIRYPGNVVNPDKAIETLGGLTSISTTVNTSNRRLELRFRPSDGYCKPACGDRHEVSGFLLRIRVKKSRIEKTEEVSKAREPPDYRDLISAMSNNGRVTDKLTNETNNSNINTEMKDLDTEKQISIDNDNEKQNESKNINDSNREKSLTKTTLPFGRQCDKNMPPTFDRHKYEDLSNDKDYTLPKLKVIGRVSTEFRFTGLCDFQYLPVTRNMNNLKKNECIYDSIYPTKIPPLNWLDNKVPYFLPPAVFSRMDSVQQYSMKTETKDSGIDSAVGKTRKRRAGFSNFIYFNSPTIPTQPPKGIETAMMVKFLNNSHLQLVRSIFDERPIWSKTALMRKSKFTGDQLRILLPTVAYYFVTGPWRVMWVRLGYDPRKDPSARIYQTLDYRLKSMHGLEQSIKGKRTYSNYILPYKSASMSKPKTAVLTNMKDVQDTKTEKYSSDDVYIYREGIIPPSRQMFYQYCDVHCDEIQEMLAKLPAPLPGAKCHEKRGWLPIGFDDQCREILNRQVRAVLRKQMNIPEDHPTSLPRKRPTVKDLKKAQARRNARLKKILRHKEALNKQKNSTANEEDEDWVDT